MLMAQINLVFVLTHECFIEFFIGLKGQRIAALSTDPCACTITQARIDGLIQANPVSDIPVGKKANNRYKEQYLFLTEDELAELMNFLADHFPRLLPMAFFGSYYGLRRSEILGLKWDAINEDIGYITIQHTVVRVYSTIASDSVKTVESKRELDLFPTAIDCLNQIRIQQKSDRDFLGTNIKIPMDMYSVGKMDICMIRIISRDSFDPL